MLRDNLVGQENEHFNEIQGVAMEGQPSLATKLQYSPERFKVMIGKISWMGLKYGSLL